MKAQKTNTETSFAPFILEIKVESENDLYTLWNLFNAPKEFISELSKQDTNFIGIDEVADLDGPFTVIDDEVTEL